VKVYCKTDKGQSEIQTRAHRLAPRARQALILVDGKRDEDMLSSLIPGEAVHILGDLLSEGFIEVTHELPMVASRPSAVSQTPRAPSFDAMRRDIVRALTDSLGPAAEPTAIRIEKTKSMADLGPAIGQAVQLVRAIRGDSAANAFASRFVA
jgi:hypothetical protein